MLTYGMHAVVWGWAKAGGSNVRMREHMGNAHQSASMTKTGRHPNVFEWKAAQDQPHTPDLCRLGLEAASSESATQPLAVHFKQRMNAIPLRTSCWVGKL